MITSSSVLLAILFEFRVSTIPRKWNCEAIIESWDGGKLFASRRISLLMDACMCSGCDWRWAYRFGACPSNAAIRVGGDGPHPLRSNHAQGDMRYTIATRTRALRAAPNSYWQDLAVGEKRKLASRKKRGDITQSQLSSAGCADLIFSSVDSHEHTFQVVREISVIVSGHSHRSFSSVVCRRMMTLGQ